MLFKFKRSYFEGIFFPSIELWSEYQSLSSTVTYTLIGKRRDLSNISSSIIFLPPSCSSPNKLWSQVPLSAIQDHRSCSDGSTLGPELSQDFPPPHQRKGKYEMCLIVCYWLIPLSSSSSSECNGVTRIYQRIKKYTLILNTEKKNNFNYMSLTVSLVKEIGIKKKLPFYFDLWTP